MHVYVDVLYCNEKHATTCLPRVWFPPEQMPSSSIRILQFLLRIGECVEKGERLFGVLGGVWAGRGWRWVMGEMVGLDDGECFFFVLVGVCV